MTLLAESLEDRDPLLIRIMLPDGSEQMHVIADGFLTQDGFCFLDPDWYSTRSKASCHHISGTLHSDYKTNTWGLTGHQHKLLAIIRLMKATDPELDVWHQYQALLEQHRISRFEAFIFAHKCRYSSEPQSSEQCS